MPEGRMVVSAQAASYILTTIPIAMQEITCCFPSPDLSAPLEAMSRLLRPQLLESPNSSECKNGNLGCIASWLQYILSNPSRS